MAIAAEAALRGQRVLWGAPVHDETRIGWSELRWALGSVGDFHEGYMTCRLPGGGEIVFRSLDDPDHARGHTADLVVIDEAGKVKPAAWYEVLRPMLIDRGGSAWIVGTPRGRNWFWSEFFSAQDRPDSMAWQAPTLGVAITPDGLQRTPHPLENPSIPFAEIQQAWSTMPDRAFRQELLAEFLDEGGGVFRNLAAACILQPAGPESGHEYLVGVDWAKFSDFTVLSVLDATTGQQVYLDRFNQLDYGFQIQRLGLVVDRYQPRTIVAERNSVGEPLVEDLRRRGWPVTSFLTTAQSKAEAVEAVSLALERGALQLLADPVQRAELEAYESTALPSGMLRYAAPEGFHDDTCQALLMAYSPLAKPPRRFTAL